MERTLIITGKGKVSARPDIAYIQFPVVATDVNYRMAVKKLDTKVKALRRCITENGLDKNDLKTSDYRVDTKNTYIKSREVYQFSHFEASHRLELEIPFKNELINSLINGIMKLEGHIEFRISFGVKDKEIYKKQLLEDAIGNAKANAAIIAKAAKVTLKEILNINYSLSEIVFRTQPYSVSDSEISEASYDVYPDLNPDDIDVAENITLTWRIE